MLTAVESEKKLLIEGEIPDSIHDAVVTGTAVRGKEFWSVNNTQPSRNAEVY